MDQPLQHILVCGAGLAARMTVAALSAHLPARIRITWLQVPGTEANDILYGNVAPPSSYDFNLLCGLDERALVLEDAAAFSFGAQYSDWGSARRSWMQAYHAPFPVMNGVLFYHHVLRQGGVDLSPYLVSVQAAANGVFAHPPEDTRLPLSRAEYGYHFDTERYGALFEGLIPASVERIAAGIAQVHRDADSIVSVELADGRTVGADLYIDCTGPDARLAGPRPTGRTLGMLTSRGPAEAGGKTARTVTGAAYGWSADIPLVTDAIRLTVFHPDDRDSALKAHGASAQETQFTTGYRDAAWNGNCLAIGQAAGVVEPLTPAPVLLLQRDIERLLSLVPASKAMAVERREFNRQYVEDYRNADLFNRALFISDAAPAGAYWQVASPVDERLAIKIEQFQSRGLHVAYDLEPFGLEDWVTLHLGMGRKPDRYDRIADQLPQEVVSRYLGDLKAGIAQSIKAMPPHAVYRQGLANYLKQQAG